jgi:hypothetical protein
MSCKKPEDVGAEFAAIRPKVRSSPFFGSKKRYLGVTNLRIPWPDYTSKPENNWGLGEHFQGAARAGNRFVISGGIKTGEQRSQLIVMDLASRRPDPPDKDRYDPWAPPSFRYPDGHSYKKPPPGDIIAEVFDLDKRMWHAGGIQAAGTIVAVPIYGEANRSEIRFVEVPDSAPCREILRLEKSGTQSKAAGLVEIPSERYAGSGYLLAVWDDEILDLHFSNGDRIEAGFKSRVRLRREELPLPKPTIDLVTRGFRAGSNSMAGTYQSVNLIVDCSGDIHLVATRNTQKASPTITGKDIADLYRMTWPGNDLTRKPVVESIDSKQMYCYDQQCNFGAGAGIYVDDDARLLLYAAAHWLHDGNKRINFNEYSAYR